MTKTRVPLIVVSVFFVGLLILFLNHNIKYQELLLDYNTLSEEHQQLQEDWEILTKGSITTTGEVNENVPGEYSFILSYAGKKYPGTSGLRRYVGKEPLRIYPSSNAPFVYEDWKPKVVELINEVSTLNKNRNHEGDWCLVLDSRGISGYVDRTSLAKIDEKDTYYRDDYGSGIETLGGFKVGDRIETLIGLLDRDYYLIYENGRIYEFPDNQSKVNINESHQGPYSKNHGLDAFVGYTNYVSYLRTDSPEFPLKDGYKVGDNALNVLDFYAGKYESLDDPESDYEYPGYTFILEEGHMLDFFIDTEELNKNSVITSICID